MRDVDPLSSGIFVVRDGLPPDTVLGKRDHAGIWEWIGLHVRVRSRIPGEVAAAEDDHPVVVSFVRPSAPAKAFGALSDVFFDDFHCHSVSL